MPAATAPAKIEAVHALGGHCELTGPQTCPQARAREIAAQGACLLDQFGLAERATDWRGNNNIAESIVGQQPHERAPTHAWQVCSRSENSLVETQLCTTYNRLLSRNSKK